MSPRPRNFAPLDLDYLTQDTIEELLDAFGCAGPLTFLAVILEAHKAAHAGPRARQGEVTLRYRALARTLRLEPEQVKAIMVACEAIGLVELNGAEDRVTVRLLKWESWESKDVTAARRQAQSRAIHDPAG